MGYNTATDLMKKTFKVMSLMALLMTMVFAFSAFNMVSVNADDDQTCTLTVYDSGGYAVTYATVRTDVSGGLSCSGGRDFSTDKYGKVTLRWSKGCYLKKIYVKGSGYSVDYKDGGNYTLRLKD
jgi:hypothetical protein